MDFLVNHPIFAFMFTIVVLWVSSRVGAALRIRRGDMAEEERGDYAVLLTAKQPEQHTIESVFSRVHPTSSHILP